MNSLRSSIVQLIAAGIGLAVLVAALPTFAFEVISTVPPRYALAQPTDLFAISAVFDETPAIPPAAAVRICGTMSGLHTGGMEQSLDTLKFYNLSEPFMPGEIVHVNYRKDVHSLDGDSLSGGFYFAFTIASAPANAQWAPRRGYGAANVPYFIYGGDVDNDWRPDVLAPNEGTNNVSVFRNIHGTGYFPTHTDYGVGSVPSSIFGEDFDNDGDQDVVTADIASSTISVLLNNGNGTFAPRQPYAAGNTCRQVHGGDFDGDNDIDICSTSHVGDQVFLFYNNGNGTFAPGVPYSNVSNGPFAIRTGDFNLDGHLDIGVACREADTLAVLTNNGLGGFTTTGRFVLQDGPWCLNGNDMDADGDFDLITVASNADRIQVLFNDGTGAFPVRHGQLSGDFPLGVYCADVDGDSDIDGLSSNYAGGSVGVYLNPGNGLIALDTTLTVWDSGSYTWAHDLDGDGDLDLSVVDENADSLFIFYNGSSPVGVPDGGSAPGAISGGPILSVRPNPLPGGSRLALSLSGLRGAATVDVVSIEGRLVKRLWSGAFPSGALDLQWDGRDGRGRAVASGHYLVSARAGGERVTREIQVVN